VTHIAARHAAEVGSKNEMPPKKNRAGGRGMNDAINSGAADRHSVAAVRALRTKIKVNITAGNTPNDDITQWSCESCCQTLFFLLPTRLFAPLLFS